MRSVKKLSFLIVTLSMFLSLISCASKSGASAGGLVGGYGGGYASKGDALNGSTGPSMDSAEGAVPDTDGGAGDSAPEQVVLPAGMMTAGAWIDNDNYEMWLDLFARGNESNGKFYPYLVENNTWGLNSQRRIKVSVMNGDNAVAGATVMAADETGAALFVAITDAKGDAYLFTDRDNGIIQVTSGEGRAVAEFSADNREIAVELSENAQKLNVIEIMLVVDVTGSMGDEIAFLRAEMSDVIKRISNNNSGAAIKLSLLFYRDRDDAVPFDYYDFADVTTESGMNAQQKALNSKNASGGGDYPEAVDDALAMAVGKQWSTGATTKIIFHVLDAPPHTASTNREIFSNAVKVAASKGIRICPIICSGADTLTEYTMREAAIHTGGTFIFVTDDSGIGGSHHDPDIPNSTVELLNSLMVRLVNGYHTGEFDPAVYWKEDPNLNNQ